MPTNTQIDTRERSDQQSKHKTDNQPDNKWKFGRLHEPKTDHSRNSIFDDENDKEDDHERDQRDPANSFENFQGATGLQILSPLVRRLETP